MRKFPILVAVTMILALPASVTKARTLHAILVSTDAADIRTGTEVGVQSMDTLLGAVAGQINALYIKRLIKSKHFVSTEINAAIDDLDVDPGDIVVFYYSGHGFHDPAYDDKFPSMYVPTSRGFYAGIRETTVRTAISAKHPQLMLVIFDSCSVIRSGYISDPRFAAPDIPPETPRSREALNRLFAARGELTLAGAEVDRNAYIDLLRGGYFTRQFIKSIIAHASAGAGNWPELLSQSSVPITFSDGKVQKPVEDVELRK